MRLRRRSSKAATGGEGSRLARDPYSVANAALTYAPQKRKRYNTHLMVALIVSDTGLPWESRAGS
jgi:hypothetical protein